MKTILGSKAENVNNGEAQRKISYVQLWLGTAHHLCFRLGPKGNRVGEWFFGQP